MLSVMATPARQGLVRAAPPMSTPLLRSGDRSLTPRNGSKAKRQGMRLLTIGTLKGQLVAAGKIAADKGAYAISADGIDTPMAMLRSGKGADLLMVDIAIDIRDLVARLDAERIHVPIVACGTHNDTPAAIAAIDAGAKEYIPLPPDPEMIAPILTPVAQDTCEPGDRDNSIATRIGACTV